MKRVLLIAAFLLGCVAHAEYGTTIYQLKFQTTRGDITGYIDLTDHSVGDFESPNFRGVPRDGDKFFVQKELVKYAYTSYRGPYEPEMDTTYILLDWDSIPVSEVQQIEIVETIAWSYLWGSAMTEDIKAGEAEWMNQPAGIYAHVGFELCDYDINIHEDTPQTKEFLEKIEALIDRLEEVRHRIQQDYEHGYTEDRDALGAYYEKVEREAEEELSELFKAYNDAKIVVISFCTC